MSSDMDNMLAKLQLALSQQSNQGPSLYGLQAQTDPNTTAALLKHLQDQAYVQQQGNRPNGGFEMINDQSKRDFARMGQGVGNLLGVGSPPQYDNSAVMQQRSAIQAGKGQLNDLLSGNMDPSQAQIQVLTKLAQAGVPGADAALAKASDDAEKLATERSTQKRNNAAGDASLDEIQNRAQQRALEQKKFGQSTDQNTWQEVSRNGEYIVQKNAMGEYRATKVAEKSQIPLTADQSVNLDSVAKKVANYELPMSVLYGRGASGADKANAIALVTAHNADYDDKNFKQSNDAIKAYGPAGTLGQQTLKLQNAINHLGLLDQYGKALESGDVKAANTFSNKLSQEFGGTAISGYNSIAPIVASEVSGALVKGGGGVEERAEKARELGSQLTTGQRSAATQGMRDLLGAQYKNYQNNYEKTTRRKDFGDMFPVEGGFGGGHGGAAPSTGPVSLDDYLKSQGH